MRIYLDVCCLNRPLDDLRIGRNRLEAEAIMEIIRRIRNAEWEMVGSEAVDAELSAMPLPERRAKVAALAQLRSSCVRAEEPERLRARTLLTMGLRYMDALHLACAEAAHCDVLLTTDDRFLAKSRVNRDRIMVRVANPLLWIAEVSTP